MWEILLCDINLFLRQLPVDLFDFSGLFLKNADKDNLKAKPQICKFLL